MHGLAYALLGSLAWVTFIHLSLSTRSVFLYAILYASLYGVSDEFHQSFIDGRHADVWDWVADTLGALLAISLITWNRGYKGRIFRVTK